MQFKCDRSLIIWLVVVCVMIFTMVIIGGVTRLTDSGLSIVEWKPLLGAIPPLNEVEWNEVFNQYKNYPEYQKVNHGMSLSEFKAIYFWEYFHRLFGRLIGVVFFIPYLYFIIRKKIPQNLKKPLLFAFILGGLQGAMGWYMVKSGLIDRPDVSHFRLAAHFGLALIIIGYIAWIIFGQVITAESNRIHYSKLYKLLVGFLFLICFQIIYGAFVAGLDAGIGYNTFPKMGTQWIADHAFSTQPLWLDLIENNVTIQFIHRTTGWIVFFFAVFLTVFGKNNVADTRKKYLYYVLAMVIIQFLLGVTTLIFMVPIPLASAHQAGAVVLLLLTLRAVFVFRKTP